MVFVCSNSADGNMRNEEAKQRVFLERIEAPTGAHLVPVVGGKRAVVRVVSRPGRIRADALIAKHRQFRLTMLPGDCPPIVMIDEKASMMALLHGSRDALERRVIQKTLRAWWENGADVDRTKAFVGPGIRACCYRFPPSLSRKKLLQRWPPEHTFKIPALFGDDHWAIDLQGFIKGQLEKRGVRTTVSDVCTCCSQENGEFIFPSHRRGGDSAVLESRFLATAWLK